MPGKKPSKPSAFGSIGGSIASPSKADFAKIQSKIAAQQAAAAAAPKPKPKPKPKATRSEVTGFKSRWRYAKEAMGE